MVGSGVAASASLPLVWYSSSSVGAAAIFLCVSFFPG